MDLRPDYFLMKAKIQSYCDETGNKINVGDEIIYIPHVPKLAKARVFCKDSKMYKDATTILQAKTANLIK